MTVESSRETCDPYYYLLFWVLEIFVLFSHHHQRTNRDFLKKNHTYPYPRTAYFACPVCSQQDKLCDFCKEQRKKKIWSWIRHKATKEFTLLI